MAGEIEKIKEKIDIAEFLKAYIDLRPAGKNLKALCPFHAEKTPSFVVSPERKMWRCFGSCGEGGDVFKFLMKYENIEFYEALKTLAERAGIALQTVSPREHKEFGVLYDINEAAKDFFQEQLALNQEAFNYLKERGLNNETSEEFSLGFSPGGEALVLHLLKKGYDIQDMARAGLTYKNAQNLYRDKFEGRIMFPIYNTMGKTVAFTGRILPSIAKILEGRSFEAPKYMNSPETPIFNKSKILYGFHRSKNEIAKQRAVFMVEGQMDFLMAWQAGVKNAVAVSGTSLTEHHLTRLRRVADSVVLSFDNDEAGINAMERALKLFGNFDFHVKTVELGQFKDPAEAVFAAPSFLSGAIQAAEAGFKKLFRERFREITGDDIPGRKRLVYHFLNLTKAIKSATEQEIWLRELAIQSGISENVLLREFQALSSLAGREEDKKSDFRPVLVSDRTDRSDLIMKRLITLAFRDDSFFGKLQENIEVIPVFYRKIVDNPSDETAIDFEMRSSFEFDDGKNDSKEEFFDLLKNLKMESLKRKQADLRGRIKRAEDDGNDGASSEALQEFYDVTKELEILKK